MDVLLVVHSVIALAICILLVGKVLTHFNFSSSKKIINQFSLIGILYFVYFIFSLMWAFRVYPLFEGDFYFISLVVLILQSILLFRILYYFVSDKRVLYYLGFYILSIFSFFYFGFDFLETIALLSSLILLLFFMSLTFRNDTYNVIGYFGIFYSLLSILFQILSIRQFGEPVLFSILSGITFFILLFVFLRDIGNYPIVPRKQAYTHNDGFAFQFLLILRHFIFIIVLVSFVFMSTIGIHEFGHFGASKFYDCEYRRIVYDGEFFHTEVLCGNLFDNTFVLLGGIALPIIVSLFLFLIGGKFMREIALLIMGFNLLLISRDLSDLGFSNPIILSATLFGILFLVLGVILLTKSRAEDSFHLAEVLFHGKSLKESF